ncbi:class I SAM-dependent methyltransferase [Candidatus Thiothrix anitrata]|uniref:Methyltransferase domain-containing protein n=1 Tax=Candidatus Thiothrix anitrata TaxID=2823902 RepID=A0ABX7X572_9GAMM|nr:class I SAM-dependent methyltransferase [Candidatus Thiothrix anitrata]QTR49978.1 methyltransferase domain-containing protein [Candidatus Thiothrix anitrata]
MNKEKPLNVATPSLSSHTGVLVCRHWYATPVGVATLMQLQTHLTRMTTDVFGYYALETGVLAGQHRFLQDSRITNRFALGGLAGEQVNAMAHPDYLPITPSNVDLVVASHSLDCSQQPHQVLREIERVLVPEGHCILVGFNPLSLRGIGQWRYAGRQQHLPCRMYSSRRVHDWLGVLGFEVLETVTAGFWPAFGGDRVFQHTRWLERLGDRFQPGVGSVYLIHAQKKVSNRTPLLPSRKVTPVLRPGIIVNPGAGRISDKRRDYVE